VIETLAWFLAIGILLGTGLIIGLGMAEGLAAFRRHTLDEREAKLQTEWDSLHTAQHLNAAFLEARRAMWEEAIRARRDPGIP